MCLGCAFAACCSVLQCVLQIFNMFSVLQCVAACCHIYTMCYICYMHKDVYVDGSCVLQCVAVCCSVFSYIHDMFQRVAVCCSVFSCVCIWTYMWMVLACCGVLQRVAECCCVFSHIYDMLQCVAVFYNVFSCIYNMHMDVHVDGSCALHTQMPHIRTCTYMHMGWLR